MLKKNLMISVAVIGIIVVGVTSGIFILGGFEGRTIKMTPQQWDDEQTAYILTCADKPDFPSLKPGDKVEITGNITDMMYNPMFNSTRFVLDGVWMLDTFTGNITSNYTTGDNITITLTVTTMNINGLVGEYIKEDRYSDEGFPIGLSESIIRKNGS